ncbi:putative GTP diphosphokinase RSH1, chloroplastic, partial [Cucurbita argyrosperma subsp. argyrosperma]
MDEAFDFFQIGWLNAIREWQEEFVGNMSSREFVDTVTRDLLGSRVFVFTPRGEIKNLPKGATVIDYSYMIHTEIGNTMVAAKVNGNLVSPTHVLANAEVVEIITYNALSGKSAYQRHKQWLQHAKTRSARHKIMKESETEEPPVVSTIKKPLWEKILDMVDISSTRKNIKDNSQSKNNKVSVPRVNGKHNHYVNVKLKAEGDILSMGNGVARIIQPLYREVLPGLDSWLISKVTSWHSLEGHSIQWLCVVCIDRKGIMGEVTTELAAAGITVCSCVAEMDRGRGLAVMLFHVEGNLDSMVMHNISFLLVSCICYAPTQTSVYSRTDLSSSEL